MAKYIKKSLYLGKTPEARAKQLANLKRGRKPGSIKEIKQQFKKLQDLNIIEFATDKNYLGLSFKDRPAQEVVLRSIYGLPLDDKQLEIYQQLTGNKKEFEPGEVKIETILALGGRSGKSLMASIIGIYEATREKWKKYLNKGEAGYIVIVATRQKQSEAIIGANCLRMIENSPSLKGLIKDSTQSELTLTNGMKIISLPCNSTAGRGLPVICLIFDEVAHFYTEGVRADENIFNSLRPRQAQFPGAKLIMISTPSAKQGLFWNYFSEGFQVPGRFTAQAPTIFMNPLVNKSFLEREKKRDIDNYNREFEAIFAEKVESFFSYDLIMNSLKIPGDIAFQSGNRYLAGIDASGLSGRDKFALAIGHKERDQVYIDITRTWNLKDPDPIMKDIQELKNSYCFNQISIDRYAKGWVQNALEKLGLEVVIRPSLADCFINLKSLMIGNKLSLPDKPTIKAGLQNTQAFFSRNNSLSIAHERNKNGHADEVDAIAGTVYEITRNDYQVEIEGRSAGPRPSYEYDYLVGNTYYGAYDERDRKVGDW